MEVKDGEMVSEPVPIEKGELIREGVEGYLSKMAVDRIDSIVRKIRNRVCALT